jgi:Abi-like protein
VTVSRGSLIFYTAQAVLMQAPILDNEEIVKLFRSTVSEARFARYMSDCRGQVSDAVSLYYFNTEVSKALYSSLQMWEIALRNKLNSFLSWKFTPRWPYDDTRALRQLAGNDRRKVTESIERQRQLRGIKTVPVEAIVADLSAGFWVSLLNSGYDVPFVWRYNLGRVCPNELTASRKDISDLSNELLALRNRVAHHEPIYHLPLKTRRVQIRRAISAMCLGANAYAEKTCTFSAVWAAKPPA